VAHIAGSWQPPLHLAACRSWAAERLPPRWAPPDKFGRGILSCLSLLGAEAYVWRQVGTYPQPCEGWASNGGEVPMRLTEFKAAVVAILDLQQIMFALCDPVSY